MKFTRFGFIIGSLVLVTLIFSVVIGSPMTVWGAPASLPKVQGGIAGTPDRTFGYKGLSLFPNGTNLYDVIALPDGKFLALGADDLPRSPIVRYLADGSLDLTFGNDGIVEIDNPNFGAYALEIDSQNRYLVGGSATRDGVSSEFAVMRFWENGTIDTTFGENGLAILDSDNPVNQSVSDMAVDSDGRILLVGTGTDGTSPPWRMITGRLTATGVPDTSFSDDGYFLLPLYAKLHGLGDMANNIALSPSGKILIGGTVSTESNQYAFAAAQLREDGSFDTSFGDNGWATSQFEGEAAATSMVTYPDGKFALIGSTYVYNNGSTVAIAIARFTTDGILDSTFGENGQVYTRFNTENEINEFAYDGVLTNGNQLLVAGTAYLQMATVRYLDNGAIDDTYGDMGISLLSFDNMRSNYAEILDLPNGQALLGMGASTVGLLRLQADGTLDTAFGGASFIVTPAVLPKSVIQSDDRFVMILIADADDSFHLGRYTADGQPDPTFSSEPLPMPSPSGVLYEINDLAIQADDKILVAGTWYVQSSDQWSGILYRFQADGQPDPTFGTNGYVLFSNSHFTAIASQPDGSTVVGGRIGSPTGLVRYTSAGDIDLTLGDQGVVVTNLPNPYVGVDELVIHPNGNIVLLANDEQVGSNTAFIAQYFADGTLDETFGTDGSIVMTSAEPASISGQSDGKLVVASGISNNEGTDVGITRFMPDGTPDGSFGAAGTQIYDLFPYDSQPADVVVAPDGAILIAGEIQQSIPPYYSLQKSLLMRVLSTGELDTNFGNNGYRAGSFSRSWFTAIAQQSTNNIMAVGYRDRPTDGILVTRYLYGDPMPSPTPTPTATGTPTATSSPSATPSPTGTSPSGNRFLWLPMVQR